MALLARVSVTDLEAEANVHERGGEDTHINPASQRAQHIRCFHNQRCAWARTACTAYALLSNRTTNAAQSRTPTRTLWKNSDMRKRKRPNELGHGAEHQENSDMRKFNRHKDMTP
jgi:hypothetical protein